MSPRTMLTVVTVSLLFATTPAAAEPHEGLLIRFTPGVASAAASATVDDTDYTLSGDAGRLGIVAGWSVAPRLVLTAELLGQAIVGPELSIDDDEERTDDDVTWGVSYAGLGINYYFKNNLYLAGSAGGLIMTLDTSEMDTSETDLGFAAKAAIGYEWWLGREWGLGVALELLGGAVPGEETDWGVATIGLALSATYN
jgi:hypothetical protein